MPMFGTVCAMECAMKTGAWYCARSMARGPEEKEIEQNRTQGASHAHVLTPLCPRSPKIERYPRCERGKDLQPSRPVCEVREIHGRSPGTRLIVAARGMRN